MIKQGPAQPAASITRIHRHLRDIQEPVDQLRNQQPGRPTAARLPAT